jgi:cyclase
MALGTRAFTQGLHDLGDGNWAWMQPDGGWGWSNAGLIVDGEESLLVDTLFDLPLTRQMLDAFGAAIPDTTITTLVNTHSNGDHCNGNELVAAEVITSAVAAAEMAQEKPEMMVALLAAAPQMGVTGEFFLECFGAFEFTGIHRPAPTTTFEGTLERTVGDTRVEMVEVGPAHTGGDVLVHVPGRSTVYTGDILFVEGHPILWAGSIPDLLRALDVIEAWRPDTIVPGHGPITDLAGLAEIRAYLEYCHHECRLRFDRGLSVNAAAADIALDRWSDWGDAERVVTLVDTCYREFDTSRSPATVTELFGAMAELWDRQRH